MTPGARVAAAISVLDEVAGGAAAEQALTRWSRASRYAGSGDRAAVRTHVFDVLRRWRSTAAQGGGQTGRARMIGLLAQDGVDHSEVFSGQGHSPPPLSQGEAAALGTRPDPDDLRDLPDWLWPLFQSSLGDGAGAAAEALRHRAPVFVRVNLSRIGRGDLAKALAADGIETTSCPEHDAALRVVTGERRLRGSAAFQAGLFDFQDLSSQRAAALVPLPGGDILDFCAGGGGKALALADRAARMGQSCRIYVHDADPRRMADLPARAKRAGAELITIDKEALKGRLFDSVLLDVPCSGSGTWRRQPQAKWQLTSAKLRQMQRAQRAVLTEGRALCRSGGPLTYMTCSVFNVENTRQIEWFLSQGEDQRFQADYSQTISNAGDGFYASVINCR